MNIEQLRDRPSRVDRVLQDVRAAGCVLRFDGNRWLRYSSPLPEHLTRRVYELRHEIAAALAERAQLEHLTACGARYRGDAERAYSARCKRCGALAADHDMGST